MNRVVAPEEGSPVSPDIWRQNLAEIGQREGFYEELGHEHTALFVKRGGTLIVTFENLDHVYDRGDNRMPWGFGFVESQGWSMLGLMAHGWTWYRDEAVFDFFDRLKEERFFEQFDRVVFYGASMGAYAAAVFSSAAPGSTVVAISPQATLDRDVASWETRYHKAWKRDFSTRYAYAPELTHTANAVHLFYDPREPLDAMHAALFRGANVTRYKCRFMGHRIASLWIQLGVLKQIVERCVSCEMSPDWFYRTMRTRRDNPRFQKEILARLEAGNRHNWIAYYCQAVLNRRGAPQFRKAMNAAHKAM